MADVVDAKTRSRMMGNIRGRNTRPELLVRSALHRLGFRFRLNDRRLPGTPDIVLPRYRAAIFVHGCFWHRHEGCRLTTTPQTRAEFWQEKFARNVTRDAAAQSALLDRGWRVATIWECETRQGMESVLERLAGWLRSTEATFIGGRF
jgi:DNA mismatch endonuclease (patch repair protein)